MSAPDRINNSVGSAVIDMLEARAAAEEAAEQAYQDAMERW